VNGDTARQALLEAFRAALAAVEPRTAVARAVELRRDRLGTGTVGVVAIGKAAAPMAWGAHDVLGARMVSGVAVGPDPAEPPPCLTWYTGSHPLPDRHSEAAGRAVIEYLESTDVSFVLFLVSGGGSAIVEVPPDGVDIGELASIQQALLHSGTPIEDLNLVRRSLSMTKNGRLLDHVRVPHFSLLISDVGDADPEVIASGPTLGVPSSAETVSAVLGRVGVQLSEALAAQLGSQGSARSNDSFAVVADGWSAARAAVDALGRTGVGVEMPPRQFSGEARRVASALVRGAASGFTVAPGEATVTVTGGGRGGRNTEAALAVSIHIDGLDDVVFAALSTDGVDGSSDAAGAIVDGGSAQRMRDASISPEAALMNNDSHHALFASGDLVHTGPTGTNVADIWMVWRS
jgi:hydroxypyruvate reductase